MARHEQINFTYSACRGHDIDNVKQKSVKTVPVLIPAHLPADIAMIRAQERLKELTKELSGYDDMDVQLAKLQKKVGDTKRKTNTVIKGMEQRLDLMEDVWTEKLDAEERKWMSVMGNREREKSVSSDVAPNTESRLLNLSGKAREISALESKLGKNPIGKDDREQLKEIRTKLDNINNEMERQGKMVSQLETQNPDAVYGVCELTENYKSSIDCLQHAIISLDQLSRLPAISRLKGGQPTQDEIVKIRDSLKYFLRKLTNQLSSACIIGSRACSPQNNISKNIKSESSGSFMTNPFDISSGPSDTSANTTTVSTLSNESGVGRIEKENTSLNSSYTSSCQTALSNASTAVAPISGNASPSVSAVSAVCPPVFSANPKTTVPPPSIQSPMGENGGNNIGKIASPAKMNEKQGK